jgi:hypothetical protein
MGNYLAVTIIRRSIVLRANRHIFPSRITLYSDVMKQETEELPTGKTVMRTFDEDGRVTKEMHSYGMLKIACDIEYVSGKRAAESYFVNQRLVGRARYEKARVEYPDMPAADQSLTDTGAALVKLVGKEKKQKSAANKRRRENALTDEQLQEAHRQMPFVKATGGDDIEVLRQFLDAGEDPNAVAIGRGFTPLYNACFGGSFAPDKSLAAVQLLLDRGADPNKRFDYDSPIDGRLDRGLTALMMAATAEVAKALLDAGAEVNVADGHGVTPLMRAAGSGRVGVVKVLLQSKADAEAKSSDGRSAADFALSKLEFFTENIEGCVPGKVEERIASYRAVLGLLKEAKEELKHTFKPRAQVDLG